MTRRVLITVADSDVAPRFDTCQEVFLADLDETGRILSRKTLVLAEPAAEEVCRLVLAEQVHAVICGGIEEEFYQFLTWKGLAVLDGVISPLESALEAFAKGALSPGDILPAPSASG